MERGASRKNWRFWLEELFNGAREDGVKESRLQRVNNEVTARFINLERFRSKAMGLAKYLDNTWFMDALSVADGELMKTVARDEGILQVVENFFDYAFDVICNATEWSIYSTLSDDMDFSETREETDLNGLFTRYGRTHGVTEKRVKLASRFTDLAGEIMTMFVLGEGSGEEWIPDEFSLDRRLERIDGSKESRDHDFDFGSKYSKSKEKPRTIGSNYKSPESRFSAKPYPKSGSVSGKYPRGNEYGAMPRYAPPTSDKKVKRAKERRSDS